MTAVWMSLAGLHVGGGRRDDHGFLRGARGRDGKRGNGQRADGGGAQRKTAEMARGHGFLFGAVGGSLEREPRFAIGQARVRCPKIRALAADLLRRAPHEFVNKTSSSRALEEDVGPGQSRLTRAVSLSTMQPPVACGDQNSCAGAFRECCAAFCWFDPRACHRRPRAGRVRNRDLQGCRGRIRWRGSRPVESVIADDKITGKPRAAAHCVSSAMPDEKARLRRRDPGLQRGA